MTFEVLSAALRTQSELTIGEVTGKVTALSWEGGRGCWIVTLVGAQSSKTVFVRTVTP